MLGIKTRIYKKINALYDNRSIKYDRKQFRADLSNTALKGFEGVDISKVYDILCIHGKRSLTDCINDVLKIIGYQYYSIDRQSGRDLVDNLCMCVLPSYDFYRKDMVDRFEKICNLINYKVRIYGNCKRINFSLERICLFFVWLRQMPKWGSIDIKLRMIASMLECWEILNEYKKISNKYNIIRCLVLCDYQPVDTIVVQYLNCKGIETVSLQHGVYSEGSIPQLKNSVACKILVYGRQSYDLFLRCGVSEDRIVVCGFPQMIGVEQRKRVNKRTFHKIGVVMSGYADDISDKRMMDIITKYSQDKDWELYLKIRIGLSKKSYCYFNDCKIKEIYSGEIDSVEFVDKMDLIICGGSTITIESIVRGVPVFIYSDNDRNAYPELADYRFSDLDSLGALYDSFFSQFEEYKNKIELLKAYYCEDNAEYNYREFFNRSK